MSDDPKLADADFNDFGEATLRKLDLIPVQIASAKAAPKAKHPELVAIPAGEFTMGGEGGEPDELPARRVELSPFAIGKYEVTNEELERFLPEHRAQRDGFSWRDREPAIYVSWTQAACYCNFLSRENGLTPAYDENTWTLRANAEGFRLPTEAEWEYVASGRGESRLYPWGNYAPTTERGNFLRTASLNRSPQRNASTGAGVQVVGDYPAGASRDGVMDLAGIWLAGTATTPVGLIGKPEPKRKFFAHYMGCYPIGYGALPYHQSRLPLDINPYGTDYLSAMGGSLVNWPLLPQSLTLTPAQSAELEIKRAIRGGIDGFAVDAWAGGDSAKATLNELFAAAERLGVPFELTICLDPSTHVTPPDGVMVQPFANSINWLLTNHGTSPNLARRDGKVLIFGYGSNGILRSAEFSTPPLTVEKCAQIATAYSQLRAAVSEPLFLHYDFDNTYLKAPGDLIARAQWAAQTFNAVGGFLGTDWSQNPEVPQTVLNNGAEWSQPIFPQYNNKVGSMWVEPGTNKLRAMHQAARDTGSTLIQFVTWNDYGEDTILAPGYSTNYTLLTLNRYLADWWKTGLDPKVEQDQVHLIFRRSVDNAPTFPFSRRRSASGVLEVTTLLKEPSTVTVPGYGAPYQAPIGLFVKQFPLQVGTVSASVARNGNTIVSVTAPEQVTDKPMREDNAMACYSSNFLAEWTADFGATTPLQYSENGDLDGDGLPNWFEMYYFGQFPLMSTAQSASASADPDNDGRSNLQEYLAQTDPKIGDTLYTVGYVWDTSGIESRGISYNPDRDSHRRDAWYYLYRHGTEGSIPHNGNYPRMPTSGVNIGYAGLMAHLSPTADPDGVSYAVLQGWIARRLQSGVWQTLLRPRDNAAVILGWRSPVTGVVSLSFDLKQVNGVDPFIIDIGRNQEPTQLATLSKMPGQTGTINLPSISVTKGDFIHLFSHSASNYGSSYGYLENIRFTLQSVTSQ